MEIRQVWSGGQTGADRAALDVARSHHLQTGGWVPRGRLAEDGPIPPGYDGLRETDTADYEARTTLNVRDSDATLLLFRGTLTGGTAFTFREANRLGRPCLPVDLSGCSLDEAEERIRAWLAPLAGQRLNVAGPRASSDPGIYGLARELLDRVFPMVATGRNPPSTPGL